MKISVVTVTFNAESVVGRTLESVATQQLTDATSTYMAQYSQGRGLEVEHWVVDGASTDNTISIVRDYSHVCWQSEPDQGLYDAMNKALRLVTGDFIVYLNAGDTLHDELTLQHVFDSIGDGTPAVVYGQTQWVDNDGRFVSMRNHWAPENLTSASFLYGMLVCHQSFYVRTDLARLTPYDRHWRFSADYDWCIRIMRLAEFQRLPMVNTHYILTSYLAEGLTTKNHAASLHERMHIMAHHYGWLPTLWRHAVLVVTRLFSRGK